MSAGRRTTTRGHLKFPNRLFFMPQYAIDESFCDRLRKKTIFPGLREWKPNVTGKKKDWETRENAFAAFSMGPLTDFWRQREEDEFTGVGGIPVRFVRFRDEKNDRVIVVCPGRIESYVKYAELAYDLVHDGV